MSHLKRAGRWPHPHPRRRTLDTYGPVRVASILEIRVRRGVTGTLLGKYIGSILRFLRSLEITEDIYIASEDIFLPSCHLSSALPHSQPWCVRSLSLLTPPWHGNVDCRVISFMSNAFRLNSVVLPLLNLKVAVAVYYRRLVLFSERWKMFIVYWSAFLPRIRWWCDRLRIVLSRVRVVLDIVVIYCILSCLGSCIVDSLYSCNIFEVVELECVLFCFHVGLSRIGQMKPRFCCSRSG